MKNKKTILIGSLSLIAIAVIIIIVACVKGRNTNSNFKEVVSTSAEMVDATDVIDEENTEVKEDFEKESIPLVKVEEEYLSFLRYCYNHYFLYKNFDVDNTIIDVSKKLYEKPEYSPYNSLAYLYQIVDASKNKTAIFVGDFIDEYIDEDTNLLTKPVMAYTLTCVDEENSIYSGIMGTLNKEMTAIIFDYATYTINGYSLTNINIQAVEPYPDDNECLKELYNQIDNCLEEEILYGYAYTEEERAEFLKEAEETKAELETIDTSTDDGQLLYDITYKYDYESPLKEYNETVALFDYVPDSFYAESKTYIGSDWWEEDVRNYTITTNDDGSEIIISTIYETELDEDTYDIVANGFFSNLRREIYNSRDAVKNVLSDLTNKQITVIFNGRQSYTIEGSKLFASTEEELDEIILPEVENIQKKLQEEYFKENNR